MRVDLPHGARPKAHEASAKPSTARGWSDGQGMRRRAGDEATGRG